MVVAACPCPFWVRIPKNGAGDIGYIGHLDEALVALGNCGIDPYRYQGFAFGFGLDRMAMLKYAIPDIRSFFESDLRWLKHYGFAALDIPTLDGGLSR